jgi:trypsin-like peptidase
MTSDPLNRNWQDISSDDQNGVNGFKGTLIWFVAWDRGKNTKALGTGFIVGGDKRYSVVFTAKHVLEGATKFQNQNPLQAPSTPDEFIHPIQPSKKTGIMGIWMHEKKTVLMKVEYAFSNDSDIAYCVLVPDDDSPHEFLPGGVPLNLQTPSKGDTIHMVTILGKETEELSPPTNDSHSGLSIRIAKELCVRRGTVTNVCEEGLGRYRFPCFTTSIPIEGGMSGGFVTIVKDQAVVSACGIISGDEITPLMEKGEEKNQPGSRGSVISSVWPALALLFPVNIYDESFPKQTIYDVVKSGGMRTFGDSIDQFELIKLGDDDYRVQRKTQRLS